LRHLIVDYLHQGAAIPRFDTWNGEYKDYLNRLKQVLTSDVGGGLAKGFFDAYWDYRCEEIESEGVMQYTLEELQDFLLEEYLTDVLIPSNEATRTPTASRSAFLGSFHIFVLAHVVRRPIIVYGTERVASATNLLDFENKMRGIYLPRLIPPKDENVCKVPLCILYNNSHFTCLVGIEEQTEYVPLVECTIAHPEGELMACRLLAPGTDAWDTLRRYTRALATDGASWIPADCAPSCLSPGDLKIDVLADVCIPVGEKRMPQDALVLRQVDFKQRAREVVKRLLEAAAHHLILSRRERRKVAVEAFRKVVERVVAEQVPLHRQCMQDLEYAKRLQHEQRSLEEEALRRALYPLGMWF
jgi:hypothetical protein